MSVNGIRSDWPCKVDGCEYPRWVTASGRAYTRCLLHRRRARREQRTTSARPCTVEGCEQPRAAFPSGSMTRCLIHLRERGRERARRRYATSEGKEAAREACRRYGQRTGFRSVKASRRRRKEAEIGRTWERMDPWPEACQACGKPIDGTLSYPDPMSESEDHAPSIAWVRKEPSYSGPLALRPVHLMCNSALGAHAEAVA